MLKKSLVTLAILANTLALTACSSDDDKNTAPSGINLATDSVNENEAGALIGQLTTVDADSNDTHTYTLEDARFVIVGDQLSLASDVALNYEVETAVTVNVTTTDNEGNAFSSDLTVNVNDVLDRYDFGERVSYTGQVARQLLILELNNYIDSQLTTDLNNNVLTTRDEVIAKLMSFYKMTSDEYVLETSQNPLTVATAPDAVQTILADVSSSLKDLSGKIAGNDATGQHKDWSTEFVAFGDKGTRTPEQEIIRLFNLIADNAEEEFFNGNTRTDALGDTVTKVYLSTDGLDYKQLIQKILLGAVNFSQGTDDYLDNDIDGKGLLSSHIVEAGSSYSGLEHQFDEGFGYFGAARDYLEYTDTEIAIKGGRDNYQGMHDTNGDDAIDFTSEYIFGHASNAAKRDLGTADNTAPTDFTAEAMNAFLSGRKLLADTAGTELTDQQMADLIAQRDIAVAAWEKAIAATVVHYINDTLGDYAAFGTDAFSYSDLAKHWSELKGFAISLQFSPFSPLTPTQHEQVNQLIGDAPELVSDNVENYKADLLQAQGILATAYAFDAENVTNW